MYNFMVVGLGGRRFVEIILYCAKSNKYANLHYVLLNRNVGNLMGF